MLPWNIILPIFSEESRKKENNQKVMNSVLNTPLKKTIALTILFLLFVTVVIIYNSNVLDKGQTPLGDNYAQEGIKGLVRAGDVFLKVDVVNTPELREQGLSGRTKLLPDEGMLFVFDRPEAYSFWMKKMNFPIDIIWIGDDSRIVDITHSASEDSFPQSFTPQAPARYVLEVNAGFSQEHGIKIGDIVELTI